MTLHSNTLKYPWTKNTVPRVEIDFVVLEGKIFIFYWCIYAISLLSPVEKGLLKFIEYPLYQMMLCAKTGWKGSVVLENKMKMWKVYNGPWLTTDKFWSYKLKWAFSSAWWAKNYIQNKKYRLRVIIQLNQREINSHHRI